MTKKIKAFLIQFVIFAITFLIIRYLVVCYTDLMGFWVPFLSFIVTTLIIPKFQAVKTKEGEKIFMKWFLIKGIKEI